MRIPTKNLLSLRLQNGLEYKKKDRQEWKPPNSLNL